MKIATIIGHFGFGYEFLDGQTVKTKILSEELHRRFSPGKIGMVDTLGGARTLHKTLFSILKAIRKTKNVIILPAQNGVRTLLPLVLLLNLFSRRKTHYVVIGGWLPELLKEQKQLLKIVKKIDYIYVETKTMKVALEELGFSNVLVMPNCKKLKILDQSELKSEAIEPYHLCTFSRVMREKGIEDAVNSVKRVNEALGRTVFTLDLYGQVDSEQKDWFDVLHRSLPDYISYKGIVPFDKSADVLKSYFALLFPTRFYTEGIPGTIIDAYAAALPVISAKWESYADIVEEGKTGIGYPFGIPEELEKVLFEIAQDPSRILKMKANCIKKAAEYTPDTVFEILKKNLEY